MLKLSDNPPIMHPACGSIREFAGRWWVAHTKARFEKAFAWDLYRQGIAYFLPMVKKSVMSGGRRRDSLAPLFPSYAFFCGDDTARYQALVTDRLCQVIVVPEQEKLIRELCNVERVLSSGVAMDLYPFAVKGKRCRVTTGPFAGVEGTVVRRDDSTRIVLEISILAQGASLEVNPSILEPAE
jgi:hypothetical protein